MSTNYIQQAEFQKSISLPVGNILHHLEDEELFIMIDDRFPELKELSPEEQLELASELAKEALGADDLHQLSKESVSILEKELAAIIADPGKTQV